MSLNSSSVAVLLQLITATVVIASDNIQEWETEKFDELPKAVRAYTNRPPGRPARIEKGKLRKDVEGFRLTWRINGGTIWKVIDERGRLRASLIRPKSPKNQPISYSKHIKPLVLENCTRCHRGRKPKGDVNLEGSYAATMEIVDAGSPDDSLLLLVIHADDDDLMPPKNRMLPEDISVIRRWIEQGAKEN